MFSRSVFRADRGPHVVRTEFSQTIILWHMLCVTLVWYRLVPMQIDTDTFVNWKNMVQVRIRLLYVRVQTPCNVAESKHQSHFSSASIMITHLHHTCSHVSNLSPFNPSQIQMHTLKVFPPPSAFPSFIGALHGLCDAALTGWMHMRSTIGAKLLPAKTNYIKPIILCFGG